MSFDAAAYWDRRYRDGRTSGAGSEGADAAYKAAYLSKFIADHDVKTIVDWGCGDGQVLELVEFPAQTQYLGVDISPTIVMRMRAKNLGPRCLFHTVDSFANGTRTQLELALSFDVLFHFPDDTEYDAYLEQLFSSATRYVLIYSTDVDDDPPARHVRHREVTRDIRSRYPHWTLTSAERPLRPGVASFFLYERTV